MRTSSPTDARSIHLAFAMFLAYLAYPAERSPVQLAIAVAVPGKVIECRDVPEFP